MNKMIMSVLFLLCLVTVAFGQNITQSRDDSYLKVVTDEDRPYLTVTKVTINDITFERTVVGDTTVRDKERANASSIDERVTQLTSGVVGASVKFNPLPIDKDKNKHLLPSEDIFVRQFARTILTLQGRNTAEEVQAKLALEEAVVVMFSNKTFNAKGINGEGIGYSVQGIRYEGAITEILGGQIVQTNVYVCTIPKQDAEEGHYNDDTRHMPSVNAIITPRISDILKFDGVNSLYNVILNCRFKHGRADQIKNQLKRVKDDKFPSGSEKFADYVIEGGPGQRPDGTYTSNPSFAILFAFED